jgi:uncharacterized membrane protein YhaH (DUF805 family)
MSWYLEVWKKYAVFSGRARRKEYWLFFLFNLIFAFLIGATDGMLGLVSDSGQGVLSTIYELAVLIPGIAVGVRRMHDTDHRGWWLFVPLVGLVFAVREGTKGPNDYGPDPKEGVSALAATPSPLATLR